MTQARQLDRLVFEGLTLHAVGPDETVRVAAAQMSQQNIGSLLVVDRDGALIGIISERDVLSKVVAKGFNPIAVRVAEIMSPSVVACEPDTSIERANQVMAANRIRHLPIVESGNPIGMVSARDLMAHELEQTRRREREHLRRLQAIEQEHPGLTGLAVEYGGPVNSP